MGAGVFTTFEPVPVPGGSLLVVVTDLVRPPVRVFAKGGGNWIIGVASESGWVRSMTSIEPAIRPSTNEVRLSMRVLN